MARIDMTKLDFLRISLVSTYFGSGVLNHLMALSVGASAKKATWPELELAEVIINQEMMSQLKLLAKRKEADLETMLLDAMGRHSSAKHRVSLTVVEG